MSHDIPVLNFPKVIIAVDKDCPRIFQPALDPHGNPTLTPVWEPKDGDISRGLNYSDAKMLTVNGKPSILISAIQNAPTKPHAYLIDFKSGETVWHESHGVLQALAGGVHTTTYIPGKGKGFIVAGIPNDTSHTTDNMAYINMDDDLLTKVDFIDNHASVWIDDTSAPNGGYLWASGRSTPAATADAKDGKCLLRKYSLNNKNNLQLVREFILVEYPENLSYMNQKEYWEDPHDIAVIDGDKLWITTESRVVEFNLKTEMVTAQISKGVFMSEVEPGANTEDIVFSASNLKSLGVKDNYIVYVQTMGKASSSTEFCITYKGSKYTFTPGAGKRFYKVRWA